MTSNYLLGQTVDEALEDRLTTGLTFTRTASYVDNVAVTWSPASFTETAATGFYRYTYTPIVAGSHSWVGESSAGDAVIINFEVSGSSIVVADAFTTIGDVATVKQMLRADTDVTFDADVTDRLTALQAMVSEQLQFKLGRTFGDPVSDTTLLLYAGNSPTLWLPRPARSITSVTAWGDVAGDTFSNGTLLSASDYVYDPVDHETGLIHGLRLIGALWPSGGSWGTDDALGFGITPVEIVGDFSDTDDDAYVPADVNYAANFLILALYRREQGIPYSMVTANGLEIPLDPWKDSVVKDVIERYQVSGRDWQLVVG